MHYAKVNRVFAIVSLTNMSYYDIQETCRETRVEKVPYGV